MAKNNNNGGNGGCTTFIVSVIILWLIGVPFSTAMLCAITVIMTYIVVQLFYN